MRISRRSAITLVSACVIIGAASACSSDSPPLDSHDAETSDVSRDLEGPKDGVTPDAAGDVSVNDAVATDARNDVSSDAASSDTTLDASFSDRTSNDAASSDASGDPTSADTVPTDSTPADAPPGDSTPADTPPTDSTPVDAPPSDGGNDPSCPPSYSAASGQCSMARVCVYPEGACGCMYCGGPPPPPDAGNRWVCSMRGAGCPIQKPAVGTACSMDAQYCNYGTCCTDWMLCENAQWKYGGTLCPP